MDKLLTTNEVAEQLRILPYTLRQWIKKGVVKSVRVGRNHLIPANEVIRLLEHDSITMSEVNDHA